MKYFIYVLIIISLKSFSSISWDLPNEITIYENNRVIYAIDASETNDESIAFGVSGYDKSLINISADGVITFKTSPNYENPLDRDKNNVYQFRVSATSENSSKAKSVKVTVENLDDEKPKITNFKSSLVIPENLKLVRAFNVADDDTSTNSLTISLQRTNAFPDSGDFIVNGKRLFFRNNPNYERPADKDKNNIYKTKVKISDGTNSNTYNLTVRVTNRDQLTSTLSLSTGNVYIDNTTPRSYINYINGERTGIDFSWNDNFITVPAGGISSTITATGFLGHFYDSNTGQWFTNSQDYYWIDYEAGDPEITLTLEQEKAPNEAECNSEDFYMTSGDKCDIGIELYMRNEYGATQWIASSSAEEIRKKIKQLTVPTDVSAQYLIRTTIKWGYYRGGTQSYTLRIHNGSDPANSLEQTSTNQESSQMNDATEQPNIDLPNRLLISKRTQQSVRKFKKKYGLIQNSSSIQGFQKNLKSFAENRNLFNDKKDFQVVELEDEQIAELRSIIDIAAENQINIDSTGGKGNSNFEYDDKYLLNVAAAELALIFPEYEIKTDSIVTHHAAFSPDPDYYLHQEKYLRSINFPEGLSRAGSELKDIYVAVIDTGSPTNGSQAWNSSSFVDKGDYDFINSESSWNGDGDGYDDDATDPAACTNVGCEYLNQTSHGTHVGSTIAAKNDNQDINGYGVKVVHHRALGAYGSGSSSDICTAIAYASDQTNDTGKTFFKESGRKRIKVINMSLGGGSSCACQEVITKAYNRGVTIVASAGNSRNTNSSFPASCDNVLSVGSTNSSESKAYYSQWNEHVDIAAPGGDTTQLWYGGYKTDGIYAWKDNDSLAAWQGTSMAAPNAAGVIANIYAQNENANAKLIWELLRKGLLTKDIGESGRDDYYGYGLVDFNKAMLNANNYSFSSLNTTITFPKLIQAKKAARKSFRVRKVGAGQMAVTNVTNENSMVKIIKPSNSTGIGTYQLRINRSNALYDGYHYDEIVLTINNGITTWKEKIDVEFLVGSIPIQDFQKPLGEVFIKMQITNGLTVSPQKMLFNGSGQKNVRIEDATYTVCASTDLDYDGILCEFGEVQASTRKRLRKSDGDVSLTLTPKDSN